MSMTCLEVGMYNMIISSFSNFSLTKCLSTSTCLILSWSTGLCEIAIAALL